MIKAVLQWFRRMTLAEVLVNDTASQLAQFHGINRRRFTRVDFPWAPVAILPRIGDDAHELPIVNLSEGGACVEDHYDHVLPNLGEVISLKIDWFAKSYPIQARIVGASKHINRHLEFVGLPESLRQDIGILVQAGSIGQRLTQAPNLESAPVRLGVAELWTTNNGENLRIVDSDREYASISTVNEDYIFLKNGSVVWRPSGSTAAPREITPLALAGLIVLLCNIQNPSLAIRELRIRIARQPVSLVPTGSEQ